MTGQLEGVLGYLEATPEHVRQLTVSLSPVDLRWKPAEDDFSVVEQVCHLRDVELEGYTIRIRRILNEEQPSLPDLDGARLADERDYNSQDFEQSLREFALARQTNVRLIKELSPDQLNRTGVLDGVGIISLERLLVLMKEHDQSHLDELSELRSRLSTQKEKPHRPFQKD